MFIEVADDLEQSSKLQMQNYIDAAREKQRQRDIMRQQAEKERGEGRPIASNANLRYVYQEGGSSSAMLPDSIRNAVGTKRKPRGRKNDLGELMREGAQRDMRIESNDFYLKQPLEVIRGKVEAAKQGDKNEKEEEDE